METDSDHQKWQRLIGLQAAELYPHQRWEDIEFLVQYMWEQLPGAVPWLQARDVIRSAWQAQRAGLRLSQGATSFFR